MTHISALSLTDFQSHSRLRMDLSSGVNSIVGPSDIGKSAIIRALRLLCLNKPGGDEFVAHGAAVTTVVATIGGTKVGRRKGRENLYRLGDAEYRSFGQEVPETIRDFLRLSDLNFQQQHDSPFWFSLTAGEVAKQLNSIVDLSVIDQATSLISAKIRTSKTEVGVVTKRCNDLERRIAELSYVPQLTAENEQLMSQATALDARRVATTKLEDRLEQLIKLAGLIDRTTDMCADAVLCMNGCRAVLSKQKGLGKLDACIERLELAIETCASPVPCLEPIANASDRLVTVSRRMALLDTLLVRVAELTAQFDKSQIELVEARQELSQAVCPLCGR